MARVTSERELVSAMWRLADQAEQRGVRIVTERASGEVFATSSSDPTTIYKVTGFSCTCTGFFHYQRCQHHSLLLASLGWLPDLDPDPEPAGPAALAVVPEPMDAPCPDCLGAGTVMRLGSRGGATFELTCDSCAGSGRLPVSPEVVEVVAVAATVGSAGSSDVGDPVTGTEVTGVSQPVDVIDAVESVSPAGGTPRPSDRPDPWDEISTATTPNPDDAPTRSVAVTGEREVQMPVGPATSPAPIPFVGREDRARALEATVEDAIATLADQLAQGHTAAYLEVLGFYSRFHKYSIPNTILIRSQRPEARLVAGLRKWNQLGYRVRAGEKATWIWAPMMKKTVDEATGELVERVVGFRPAPVFADSQIVVPEDKPLPSLFHRLPDDLESLYRAAKGRIVATGIAVEERPLPGGVQGVSQGGRILVRAGLDSRNRLFVLLHELAHEIAHQGEGQLAKSVAQREFEAESTSFVAAAALGLHHPTAADYLLAHDATAEGLRQSLGTIQTLVRRVIAIVRPVEREEVPIAA